VRESHGSPPQPALNPLRIPLLLSLVGAVALNGCSKKSSPTEPPPPPPAFTIELRWLGTTPELSTLTSFTKAVDRIGDIVTAALPTVALPADFTNVSQCNENLTGYPDVPRDPIEGVVIYAIVEPIDGPGNVLGSAGPCLIRPDPDSRPALGVMRFDDADLDNAETNGHLDALVLHEMLHVVGLGTIWRDKMLLEGDNTADARFLGFRARTACSDVNGGSAECAESVPVHSTGGSGSAYSHWREDVFLGELMTPILNSATAPLSAMSIRSLEDLGYSVSVSTADPFLITAAVMAAQLRGETGPSVTLPEPMQPRFRISATNTLVPFESRR